MTTDHRRVDVQMAQVVLLDDPGFLHEIVERVVQQILETEMTEHTGAARYEKVAGPSPTASRACVSQRLWRSRCRRSGPRGGVA